MAESNREQMQQLVLAQCAPVITDIKASNMVTIPKNFKTQLYRLFYQSGISCFCLYEDEERSVVLLYRKNRLRECIETEEAVAFLRTYGYGHAPVELHLERLRYRLSAFYRGEMEFPHELGVFLEYPIGDIVGFIQNKGRNSLFSGYWKVYQNPEKARNTFRQYDRARSEVLSKAKSGLVERICLIGNYNKKISGGYD